MKRPTDCLRTCVCVELLGAAQEAFLNDLAEAGVRFWEPERIDAVHLHLTLPKSALPSARTAAERRLCSLTVLRQEGLFLRLRPLLRRPVLIVGLFAAIVLSFALQNRVLLIRVEGNRSVQSEEILQALADLGVYFGARSDGLDVQQLRNRMLLEIPELSWCTVNRKGCVLTVPVTERELAEPAKPQYTAAHIVALRDGVLRQVSVFEGMSLCAAGDAVRKGQILVSAFEDYGLYLRAVCSDAEIYALTRHTGAVVCPAIRQEKVYTGEQWTEYCLVIGNFRRKIGQSSSFLRSDCDRITERKVLRAPDGTQLPVSLEITTCRAYTLRQMPLDEVQAQTLLQSAWQRLLRGRIVGTITQTDFRLVQSGECYTLYAESACDEMIAVLLPIEPVYGGIQNGESDQRRTN